MNDKPAHSLEEVKKIVQQDKSRIIFSTRRKTTDACRKLGIPKSVMFEILLDLDVEKHFFKQMADYYIEHEFLDVYHYDYEGIPLYIKFKIHNINGKQVIITSMHKR